MAQSWIITLIPHFSAQQSQIDLFNSHWCSQDQWDAWSCQRSHNLAHTHKHTRKVIYCSHRISWTHKNTRHVNKAHQAVVCRNQKIKMLNMKETHTVKAAFTPMYFILLFPPSSTLSSAVLPICCTAFGLSPLCGRNSLWSGFLTCVQIGKLQDGELSLVRFMWSQGACEKVEFGRCCWWGLDRAKRTLALLVLA